MESELLRMGKGTYDLSEMFIVRQKYMNQLQDNYLRRGRGNIGQGSLSHTFMNAFRQVGIVPEEVYSGINYDSKTHNHVELAKYMKAIATTAIDMKKRSPEYFELINSLFDIYMGQLPEKFTYQGKEYTPKSFAESLGLNMDDYIELTSFTHHPYYEAFELEVPDNWEHARMYNLPLDELIAVTDHALRNGYTVCWDGDVSEKGFSFKNGVAINPEVKKIEDYSTTDRARFEKMGEGERLEEVYKFEKPFPEVQVTPEIRQEGFEAFVTTDDGSAGRRGFTTDALAELLANSDYDVVYTCGPEVMMAGVARLCHEAGVACRVSMERMMCCGFGACGTCNVAMVDGTYKSCCKDGPVFDAEEVAW